MVKADRARERRSSGGNFASPVRAAIQTTSLLGIIAGTFGDYAESISRHREAMRAEPLNGHHWNNLGSALLDSGDTVNALDTLARATALPGGRNATSMSNIAEALATLGQHADARSAFAEAVHLTDFSAPHDLLRLACQAAELGYDVDAAELYARFVSIRDHRPLPRGAPVVAFLVASENDPRLLTVPALAAAVARVIAFGGVKPAPIVWADDSGDDALRLFEDTKSLRDSATEMALRSDG